MLNRIPPALLVSRVGGLSLAHEVRKACFLKDAPTFLRELASSLGEQGTIKVIQQNPKMSGIVSFTGESLKMELFEDPGPQDGVQLVCNVLQPDGAVKSRIAKSLRDLAKGDAWGYHVHVIKTELGTRPLFH